MRVFIMLGSVAALGAAACHPPGDRAGNNNNNSDGGGDDPTRPGLAFDKIPAAANVLGRFEVWARLNDPYGNRIHDFSTIVSIGSSGSGSLRGTISRRAIDGQVVFDDLIYDRWEKIDLSLAANGFRTVTTQGELPVRPLLRFVKMPPAAIPRGEAVGPFEIELVDGRGQPVAADQPIELDGVEVEATGGPVRSLSLGRVRYDQVVLRAAGARTLVWRSPGLADLVHPLRVYDGEDNESVWLPAARVGVPYRASLPATADEYRLLGDGLPRGLTLERSGELRGIPTTAGHVRVQVFATRTGDRTSVLYQADLSIFPATESGGPPSLDALDVDGPYAVGAFDDGVPVPSRKTSVRVRVFFPTRRGQVAGGPFPLVVFHHGAVIVDADHPSIFDRFDHLLRRWASHGYVVATIDAPELVWANGRLVGASLSNLSAMSENQRATIAYFKQRALDPTFTLGGHVDSDRVIVAGHSRGGGASLMTARAEPSVVGGILIKPLDPMGTVGGEKVWNIPLPPKPFLLLIGGADGDLPYPMVDFLYERRSGPMVAPTILGSLHSWTCDATCPPDEGARASIPREQDWAVTNAYAVAFLDYAARGDLSIAPLLFGAEGLSNHLSGLGTLVRSDRAAASLLVDDFQQDTAGRNRLGLLASDHQMVWSSDEPSLITALRALPASYDPYRLLYAGANVLNQSAAHRLEWATDGASYTTALGGLDVRGRAAFVFRARTDNGTLDGGQFALRFRDAAGSTALLPGTGHLGEAGIGPRFSDIIVPLTEIEAAGVDLTQLDSLELVVRGAGSLLLDDLRFE